MAAATHVTFAVHMPLVVEGNADSVREALERTLPSPTLATLEYLTHLRAVEKTLERVLAVGSLVTENPYFFAPPARAEGEHRIVELRDALTACLLEHAEFLADARVAQTRRGWTALMVTWFVLAQTLVIGNTLACARRDALATDARARDDDDDDIDVLGDDDGDGDNDSDSDSEHSESSVFNEDDYDDDPTITSRAPGATPSDGIGALDAAEVLTSPCGETDVPYMSMAELRLALDTLRDRLFSLDDVDASLMHYVFALEMRASAFATGLADERDDYDVERWIAKRRLVADDGSSLKSSSSPSTAAAAAAAEPPVVSPAFVAQMAWYFVALKRHLKAYVDIARPGHFATAVSCSRYVDVRRATLADRAGVVRFFDTYMCSLDTADHEEQFLALATPYLAAPGDIEAHSYVYGMFGAETSTSRDVVSTRRTADGTAYVATRKFRGRSLVDWWLARARRERLAPAASRRHVGGGAYCESFFEELAVVYAMNALFTAKVHGNWLSWFVVGSRDAATFDERLRLGVDTEMPILVQRLGRWACIVPSMPARHGDDGRRVIEMRAGIDVGDDDDDDDDDDAVVVYDAADTLDALALWLRFMLDGWRGSIHHAPNLQCSRLFARILAGDARD
jgi:hypothetical protein